MCSLYLPPLAAALTAFCGAGALTAVTGFFDAGDDAGAGLADPRVRDVLSDQLDVCDMPWDVEAVVTPLGDGSADGADEADPPEKRLEKKPAIAFPPPGEVVWLASLLPPEGAALNMGCAAPLAGAISCRAAL